MPHALGAAPLRWAHQPRLHTSAAGLHTFHTSFTPRAPAPCRPLHPTPRPHTLSPASITPAPLQPPPLLAQRIGHGFDLHRLAEGYKLIIGGIDIPHTKGCEAHSDGDVLLHTITDAILGALCLPDIGQLFPDTDPVWKGANSDRFLSEAVRLMRERGYVVGNLDCTIIAEKPKLSPHKENIRNNVARLLGAHPGVINVKAKTHEKVDSIGEQRSIACHAVVMLILADAAPPRPSLLPADLVPAPNQLTSVASMWGDTDV